MHNSQRQGLKKQQQKQQQKKHATRNCQQQQEQEEKENQQGQQLKTSVRTNVSLGFSLAANDRRERPLSRILKARAKH